MANAVKGWPSRTEPALFLLILGLKIGLRHGKPLPDSGAGRGSILEVVIGSIETQKFPTEILKARGAAGHDSLGVLRFRVNERIQGLEIMPQYFNLPRYLPDRTPEPSKQIARRT